jgi:hypothetical protein
MNRTMHLDDRRDVSSNWVQVLDRQPAINAINKIGNDKAHHSRANDKLTEMSYSHSQIFLVNIRVMKLDMNSQSGYPVDLLSSGFGKFTNYALFTFMSPIVDMKINSILPHLIT